MPSRTDAGTPPVANWLDAREWGRWACGTAAGNGFLGALLVWLSLPPVGLWPLAWIAPVPWLWAIRRRDLSGGPRPTGPVSEKLDYPRPARRPRPYRALWLAGFAFWLAAYYWLTLVHWATSLGWLALCAYLAFYLPVFVGLSRVAVHRLGVSVVIAAPVVWTGLELARSHLLTGINMASLGHTQYQWLTVIQISDLGGAYAVSFLVMFVAACIARMLALDGRRAAWWPLAPAAAALAATLIYGHVRMQPAEGPVVARIGLVQGSVDVTLSADPKMAQRVTTHYREVAHEVVDRYPHLDAIVWPEAMYREPLIEVAADAPVPPEADPEKWRVWREKAPPLSRRVIADDVRQFGCPTVLGLDTWCIRDDGSDVLYNSAALVCARGRIVARYDKQHPVMFGEYVPWLSRFPAVGRMARGMGVPLPPGLTPGDGPVAFKIGDARFAVSICYENVLPHLIREQVNALETDEGPPDALLNLTNDGWFWGSSELDLHLICAVFRAVECRKPCVVAANTGFSAHIDGDGRVLVQGPRREPAALLAEVRKDGRPSVYLRWGDWFAGACLLGVVMLCAVGGWDRLYRFRRQGG